MCQSIFTVRPQARPHQQGFTLVELLVTIALLAILMSLAIPSFLGTLRAWQRDVATRAFISHAQLARSEAIKSSRTVVMCTSADGASCAGDTDTNWMQGWIVFLDLDDDRAVDSGETVIAVKGASSGLQRMETNSVNGGVFRFLPSGLMPASQTTLRIEPQDGVSIEQNAVTISSTGRARVSKEAKGTT